MKCDGTCITWGDGHYKTFDGRWFNFPGKCKYDLIKSKDLKFKITIQNVECGSTGVTCTKAITLKEGSDDDKATYKLIRGYSVLQPTGLAANYWTVIDLDYNVLVYSINIGYTLLWNKGTWLQIKLSSDLKNKLTGLCGYYDGVVGNDFQKRNGMEATSELDFGNSWKALTACPSAVEPSDACQKYPKRKFWAASKCKILYEDLFSPCHSRVPVKTFYKKCVADSCACDYGGDCECMCTAISAYAQLCKDCDIMISWRSSHFCPMQCDEGCEHYSPCVEMCYEATCVDGCCHQDDYNNQTGLCSTKPVCEITTAATTTRPTITPITITTPIPTTTAVPTTIEECNKDLDVVGQGTRITSDFSNPENTKLYSEGWIPNYMPEQLPRPYVEFYFNCTVEVFVIGIQGVDNMYVTELKLYYKTVDSDTIVEWNQLIEVSGQDNHSVVTIIQLPHDFPDVVYLKAEIIKFHIQPALRIAFYGCVVKATTTQAPQTTTKITTSAEITTVLVTEPPTTLQTTRLMTIEECDDELSNIVGLSITRTTSDNSNPNSTEIDSRDIWYPNITVQPKPYVDVTFDNTVSITSLTIQGDEGNSVTKLKLYHKESESESYIIMNNDFHIPNQTNNSLVVKILLPEELSVVVALRVEIDSYNVDNPTVRFGIFGCLPERTTTIVIPSIATGTPSTPSTIATGTTTTTSTIATGTPSTPSSTATECNKDLDVVGQGTRVTSDFSNPENTKLYSEGWIPNYIPEQPRPYVEFYFNCTVEVFVIGIQGVDNMYVTELKLYYKTVDSDTIVEWNQLIEVSGQDNHSVVTIIQLPHDFPDVVYLKAEIIKFHIQPALRIAFYGCVVKATTTQAPQTTTRITTSAEITTVLVTEPPTTLQTTRLTTIEECDDELSNIVGLSITRTTSDNSNPNSTEIDSRDIWYPNITVQPKPYVDVTFDNTVSITSLTIQGDEGNSVTKLKLYHKESESESYIIMNNDFQIPNQTNNSLVVKILLPEELSVVVALRVEIDSYNVDNPTVRFGIFGCLPERTTTIVIPSIATGTPSTPSTIATGTTTTTSTIATGTPSTPSSIATECNKDLDVVGQGTRVTSDFSNPENTKLYSEGWIPNYIPEQPRPYVEFYFNCTVEVFVIGIQGVDNMYVTELKLYYKTVDSDTIVEWNQLIEVSGQDNHSVVTIIQLPHDFPDVVYLKAEIIKFHIQPALRIAFYGCVVKATTTQAPQTTTRITTSAEITTVLVTEPPTTLQTTRLTTIEECDDELSNIVGLSITRTTSDNSNPNSTEIDSRDIWYPNITVQPKPYVDVTFDNTVSITSLTIQGDEGNSVTKLKLYHKESESESYIIMNNDFQIPNQTNNSLVVKILLPEELSVVVALRVEIDSYNVDNPTVRFGIFGCLPERTTTIVIPSIATGTPSTPSTIATGTPTTTTTIATGTPSTPSSIATGTPSTSSTIATGTPSTPSTIATSFTEIKKLTQVQSTTVLPTFPAPTRGTPSTPITAATGTPSTPSSIATGTPSTPSTIATGTPSTPSLIATGTRSTPSTIATGTPSTPSTATIGTPITPSTFATFSPPTALPATTKPKGTCEQKQAVKTFSTVYNNKTCTTGFQIDYCDGMCASTTTHHVEIRTQTISYDTKCGCCRPEAPVSVTRMITFICGGEENVELEITLDTFDRCTCTEYLPCPPV
ncbi:uncharacterized protein [Antedon mediterranea]|uniref:uncharacterized protein n=1 Tax=Antedon mediterranea TaxID=105859 RepID=UPI003AF9DDAF